MGTEEEERMHSNRKGLWRALGTCLTAGLTLAFATTSLARTPDGETPAVEDVCADEPSGVSFGLCNAYCEAMDCDSETPNASARACERVRAKYEEHARGPLPCEAVECPCAAFYAEAIGVYESGGGDLSTWDQCAAPAEPAGSQSTDSTPGDRTILVTLMSIPEVECNATVSRSGRLLYFEGAGELSAEEHAACDALQRSLCQEP
jgi:hypothetical protein